MTFFLEEKKVSLCVCVSQVPTVGGNAFLVAKAYTDDVCHVTESEIALAILRLLEHEKVIIEGGGATGRLMSAPFSRSDARTEREPTTRVCSNRGGDARALEFKSDDPRATHETFLLPLSLSLSLSLSLVRPLRASSGAYVDALRLAAILPGGAYHDKVRGKTVCVPLCGGNIDVTTLGRVMDRGKPTPCSSLPLSLSLSLSLSRALFCSRARRLSAPRIVPPKRLFATSRVSFPSRGQGSRRTTGWCGSWRRSRIGRAG